VILWTVYPRGKGHLCIAYLLDQFPELTETFISGELHEQRRAGHRVHVESLKHAPDPDPSAANGLDVAYLSDDDRWERIRAMVWLLIRHPLQCARDLIAHRRWRQEESVRSLRSLAPAARRIDRVGANHLHAHFAGGAALDALRLGSLLGLPYSVATHGYDVFQLPTNLREKHQRAAFAVTACEYSQRYLNDTLGLGPRARIERVIVGVDGDVFRRSAPYPGGRTVVAVGRLVEKKGFGFLLHAAALLRDRGQPLDRVLIVGDGPLRLQLADLSGELDLDGMVDFVGSRRPDEVREILDEADLLAAPCIVAEDGDRDTMPVVVKEALAMEIPVVASDEVGLPEIVKPEWGRLVPPGDVDALATAIGELLTLPHSERLNMGAAGREFVLKECSLRTETSGLAELIRTSASNG
jgi:colanic acid/amylovoran biosynthesis glycosyltransferase